MSAQAQPDVMPFLKMRLDSVVCLEPGLSPSSVVAGGTPVSLRTEIGFDGLFAALLIGKTGTVRHHAQRIEDGVNVLLPVAGGTFTVTAANLAHITVTAGSYSTGTAGSNLPIPPGSAAATYRIVSHVHFDDPAIRPIVAAFNDGLMIMVS